MSNILNFLLKCVVYTTNLGPRVLDTLLIKGPKPSISAHYNILHQKLGFTANGVLNLCFVQIVGFMCNFLGGGGWGSNPRSDLIREGKSKKL